MPDGNGTIIIFSKRNHIQANIGINIAKLNK